MSNSDPAVSMIGPGSAPAMLAARALLAANGVAHRYINTDTDPVGALLAEHARLGVERPVAAFADGARLAAPAGFLEPAPVRSRHDPSTQAHRCGLHTRPAHELYDVVVIGAGPAGLTAAVYAASQALRFGAELLVRVEIARRDRIRTAASPWSSAGGGRLRGRSGVIATDVAYRRPDAPGVEALVGRGASYGSAPAQAPGHRDQDVVIVGGANSAKRPCT